MNKLYNTQEDIATNFRNFLSKNIPSIRKTQLNILPYILIGMIDSESSVSGDIAKKLKDNFSTIQYDSITRRIRRFYNNELFDIYQFYDEFIRHIISKYKVKHKQIHIIFDHMYSKDNYTVLMFSLRVGKQGIPLYFRCFEGIRDPNAFLDKTICDGIKTISSYFEGTDYNLIYLADRWFNSEAILSTINELGHTYNIRFKSNIKIRVYDNKEGHYISKYTGDLSTYSHKGKYYNDVYVYENSSFKSNIVISKSDKIDDPWIILSNGELNQTIRNYSYRFGGIECVFKNQKSNGFYIECINNAKLKGFTTMFGCVCFCVTYLTMVGCDFTKNTKCYKNTKIKTHSIRNNKKVRIVSLFNTGLILFTRAICSLVYIRIPFNFVLHDI